ncbi:hypothetical protein LQZ19_07310 [Treponema primitia]|uniref:hypothetical protein n=1 Tax=Treponema primitia TaxID=88058 RepID=UPI00397F211F
MKKIFLVSLFLLIAFNGFSETYGQIQNRFKLWYTDSMIQRVRTIVSEAIDKFNQNKTKENYLEVIRSHAVAEAYWQTVRDTAEKLYEIFGDRMGDFKYNVIFESASDNYDYYDNKTSELIEDYQTRFPNEDGAWNYWANGNSLFSDYFNTATRRITN